MENDIFELLCEILGHVWVYEDYDDGIAIIKNWKRYCKFCRKTNGYMDNAYIRKKQQTKTSNTRFKKEKD